MGVYVQRMRRITAAHDRGEPGEAGGLVVAPIGRPVDRAIRIPTVAALGWLCLVEAGQRDTPTPVQPGDIAVVLFKPRRVALSTASGCGAGA